MIEGIQPSYLEQKPDKKILTSLISSETETLASLERRKETALEASLPSINAQITDTRNKLADLREQLREAEANQ